ncbi:MAG TPA: hypothetical protein VEK56_18440 [Vicinamibacterales bacterium]|nr:hypothetical protein [Vicinamibacterales bacterium]
MKTIIQLLIAALLINACIQAARAYWGFYEFKDEIQFEIIHGREVTTSQLHQRVLALAADRDVALAPEDVTVKQRGYQTLVDVSYVDEIPFVPRVYSRPWTFEGTVTGERLRALKDDSQR